MIGKLKNIDLRKEQVKDKMKLNEAAMKNIQRDDRLAKIKWKQSQIESYPEGIDLNLQTETLKDFINIESTRRENDNSLLRQDVMKKLLRLTNKEIAEEIIGKLDDDDIINFNRQYKKVVSDLKKQNDKISRDQFVDYIKNLNSTPDEAELGKIDKTLRDDLKEAETDIRKFLPSSKSPIKKSNIFRGIEYYSQKDVKDAMQKLSIDELNEELEKVGEKPTKGKTLAYADLLKYYGIDARKKGFFGKGISVDFERIPLNDGKMYLELNELRKNNINVKYTRNKKPISNFKPVIISNDLRKLVLETLNGEGFDKQLYDTLKKNEQGVFRRFSKAVNLDVDLNDDKEEIDENTKFRILLGSVLAGNNNEMLLKELRRYAIKAHQSGMISKYQLNNIFLDIATLI